MLLPVLRPLLHLGCYIKSALGTFEFSLYVQLTPSPQESQRLPEVFSVFTAEPFRFGRVLAEAPHRLHGKHVSGEHVTCCRSSSLSLPPLSLAPPHRPHREPIELHSLHHHRHPTPPYPSLPALRGALRSLGGAFTLPGVEDKQTSLPGRAAERLSPV